MEWSTKGWECFSGCSVSDGSSASCSGLLLFVVHMAVGMKHVQHALLLDGILMDTHISRMDYLSLYCLTNSLFLLFSSQAGFLGLIFTLHLFVLFPPFFFLGLSDHLKDGVSYTQCQSVLCCCICFSVLLMISSCFSLSYLLSTSIRNQPAIRLVNYFSGWTLYMCSLSSHQRLSLLFVSVWSRDEHFVQYCETGRMFQFLGRQLIILLCCNVLSRPWKQPHRESVCVYVFLSVYLYFAQKCVAVRESELQEEKSWSSYCYCYLVGWYRLQKNLFCKIQQSKL